MGAFDSIEAEAACPHCGDIHYIRGTQTKFFEPDYYEQRWMRPGEWHALEQLPGPEHSEWSRVRDPVDDNRIALLADFDEMFECGCECPCAQLMIFTHAPGQLMLERIELHDARTDLAALVDYADDIVPWTGKWETYRPELRAFERRPYAERAAALRAAFAARFDREPADIEPYTALVGPTRCEACGITRERVHHTLLSGYDGSLLGEHWRGGAIMIGDRVELDEVRVGARLHRLRAPGETITILGATGSWGCRCGAGPARYVARFDREPGAVVLVDLALRATDETSDIDYAER